MSQLKVPANQDLESLCYLETMFQEYGFDDGFRDGEKSGELEGRLFGCEKAFDLGREIGFYSGCIDMWELLYQTYPEKVSSKALKQMETLKRMIEEFPTFNDHDVDLFALRDKMKNKFRVVTSLLVTIFASEGPKVVSFGVYLPLLEYTQPALSAVVLFTKKYRCFTFDQQSYLSVRNIMQ